MCWHFLLMLAYAILCCSAFPNHHPPYPSAGQVHPICPLEKGVSRRRQPSTRQIAGWGGCEGEGGSLPPQQITSPRFRRTGLGRLAQRASASKGGMIIMAHRVACAKIFSIRRECASITSSQAQRLDDWTFTNLVAWLVGYSIFHNYRPPMDSEWRRANPI
jgi:hypothetical protein